MRRSIPLCCLALLLAAVAFAAEGDRQPPYDPARAQHSYGNQLPADLEELPQPQLESGRAPEQLFVSNVTIAWLLLLDKLTCATTPVGPMTSPIVAGLAHDPGTGRLYGTDTLTNDLVWIDPATGATTIIGNTGLTVMHGVALDPRTGILYTADDNSDLYILDKNSAAPTFVGSLGYPHIGALDFDPLSGVLYGAYAWSDGTGYLVTINTATGVATYVAPTHRLTGLAFDRSGVLYGLTNSLNPGGNSQLFIVNKSTGAHTLVGNITTDNLLGLTFTSRYVFEDGFESGDTSAWSASVP